MTVLTNCANCGHLPSKHGRIEMVTGKTWGPAQWFGCADCWEGKDDHLDSCQLSVEDVRDQIKMASLMVWLTEHINGVKKP